MRGSANLARLATCKTGSHDLQNLRYPFRKCYCTGERLGANKECGYWMKLAILRIDSAATYGSRVDTLMDVGPLQA